LIEIVSYLRREIFEATYDQSQLFSQGSFIGQLLLLFFHFNHPLSLSPQAWLELVLVDETLGIAVYQS
jgi:hypothetical protein